MTDNSEDFPKVLTNAGADGCSGGISRIYGRVLKRDVPFLYCCDEHDLAYDEGGGWRDRLLADRRFAACVWAGGRPARAVLFWIAVRLAGWWFWKKRKREHAG